MKSFASANAVSRTWIIARLLRSIASLIPQARRSSHMIFLNERQVAELLPIADVLNALERAFIAQARDEVRMPLRTIAPNADGLLGAMPAAIIPAPAALGAKLVTVFHKNGARGLPTHQALITLFDADT